VVGEADDREEALVRLRMINYDAVLTNQPAYSDFVSLQ